MNPIKQWWLDRKFHKQAARIKQKIDENKERDRRRTILKEKCKEVADELEFKRFTVVQWSTTNAEFSKATMYALTPNGRLIQVTVFEKGGIEMEDIGNK